MDHDTTYVRLRSPNPFMILFSVRTFLFITCAFLCYPTVISKKLLHIRLCYFVPRLWCSIFIIIYFYVHFYFYFYCNPSILVTTFTEDDPMWVETFDQILTC